LVLLRFAKLATFNQRSALVFFLGQLKSILFQLPAQPLQFSPNPDKDSFGYPPATLLLCTLLHPYTACCLAHLQARFQHSHRCLLLLINRYQAQLLTVRHQFLLQAPGCHSLDIHLPLLLPPHPHHQDPAIPPHIFHTVDPR